MASEKRVITSESVLAELGAKMEQDAAFIDQLRQDPVTTLDALGIEVPAGVMVRLEPESATTYRLAAYRSDASELTDEDLSKVAGGVAMPNPRLLGFSRPFKLSAGLSSEPILIAYLAAGA
jgi:hypothetical protein